MTGAARGASVIADAGPRFTPLELARLLRLPRPTDEQAAIISAPVEPLLVVAGAGSGKTETMAARVVWLVANAYVRPEQVLGLTFTRKAAGELAHRVRTRLGQLVRRLGRQLNHPDEDLLGGEPTIATYHSYAGRVVTEHGLRSGFEPATRLLTEASRWQVVDGLVRRYAGDMEGMSSAPATVTDAVLSLAAELSEHLVDPAALAAWTGRCYAELTARPGRTMKVTTDVLALQQLRLKLLPLVRRYAERKRELEAMDFSDQLARAAVVARGHPDVGRIERDRYRVVLLDEYQDTSHAQVVMLNSLFGDGHPVTAVGDPCQSIYGWRGASAGTLERFGGQFRRPDGTPARELTLTTSWRNRPEILSVANALSAPLRRAGARVAELSSSRRVAGALGDGATVRCALLETVADEASWLSDRVVAAWRAAAGLPDAAPEAIPVEARPTTAVLVRVRSQIPAIEAALRARGVPVDVVGLGGLLDTPEVRDVVCTLRVLADPADGAALLRLLTGARWRIGPRDLVALHRLGRSLTSRRRTERLTAPPETPPDAPLAEGGDDPLPDRLDEVTLIEALAELEPAAPGFSVEGRARLLGYAMELDALRQRLDQPLPDLVADVERTLGLDVEVAVRALGAGRGGDAGLARGHLDALGDVAARFAGEAEGATLSGFLAYLAAAEEEERGLEPGEVDVVAGAVQILTAHAAKGLEWDVVAVAGLCRTQWPGRARNSDHYLHGLGVLPFPLRGDRAGLPALRLETAVDQKEVAAAVETFKQDWQRHDEREERRLAYVAVTRPRRLLLCSGHWWGAGTKTPRGPSALLLEVRAGCLAGAGVVDDWAPEPAPNATNPTAAEVARAVWPADPLGARRAALERAADLVREYLAAPGPRPDGAAPPQAAEVVAAAPGGVAPAADEEGERWGHEVTLLLAERERSALPSGPIPVTLPDHLTVSQLVTLRRDPQGLARALRRPMPSRPDAYGRRGTAFHRWLEQRFGGERLLDVDELPGAADEDAAPDAALSELKERFLASDWADRVPVEVEVPFATTIGGVVIRGRMDAVFEGSGSAAAFDVVDWKTGRRPTGADAEAAAVQLAAYRLAWATLAGVPVERVRAAFHYVRDGVTVSPADLLDAAGLTALVTGVPAAKPSG